LPSAATGWSFLSLSVPAFPAEAAEALKIRKSARKKVIPIPFKILIDSS
jgi:hypothetical protein